MGHDLTDIAVVKTLKCLRQANIMISHSLVSFRNFSILPDSLNPAKHVWVVLILVFCQLITTSQPCLPEGITFSTQAQIDSFQTSYPACYEIIGDVTIINDWSNNISNLSGLSNLTTIGGALFIGTVNTLADLTGLNNVTSIGNNLEISHNQDLTSLTGLEGLTFIGGNLLIENNPLLTSLLGLNNLSYIGQDLIVSENSYLVSLTGLDNIRSIGGDLGISTNSVLVSLAALEHLVVIPGDLSFFENPNLSSLNGLEGLTSVGGHLSIMYNYALPSLTKLEGLNSVGESFTIAGNHKLSNLTGLEGLTSIGGDTYIAVNSMLTSLTGLEGLTSVGESLHVDNNGSLVSLTGLDNINAGSLINIGITQNPCLSKCEVKSICDRLASPGCSFVIQYNAPGCNSEAEVEAACEAGTDEVLTSKDGLAIFPNPSYDQFNISFTLEQTAIVNLEIINKLGRVVTVVFDGTMIQGEHRVIWNAEEMPSGIYFYRFTTGGQSSIGKMVVVR